MPLFVKRNQQTYLITSYKVMYSTLSKQLDVAQKIDKSVFVAKLLLHRLRLNNIRCYLLARNPYSRLESFYKSKLQLGIIRKMNTDTWHWQDCQKIFFPLMGLTESTSNTHIAETLLGITFTEFVAFLPLSLHKRCSS